MVHRTAQPVQIATAVDFAAACLLGRHVVDRPDRDAVGRRERRRAVGLHQHPQAEVEDLDPAIFVQENIGGLDIAMDDPLLVGMRSPSAAWAA